jgi:hypothetical protein
MGGVIVSVLASSAVDRGLEPRSVQTKDYGIGICCFSAKHAASMRKSKHWLARNQDNVSEWGDMSVRGLVSVSYHYKNPTKRVGLVQDLIIISLKINLFSTWYSWKIVELALNNNHLLTRNGLWFYIIACVFLSKSAVIWYYSLLSCPNGLWCFHNVYVSPEWELLD